MDLLRTRHDQTATTTPAQAQLERCCTDLVLEEVAMTTTDSDVAK